VWPWAVGALLLGAAATWAVMAATVRTPAPAQLALVEPPPTGTRFLVPPVPSPDGRRLALLAVDATGKARLWTRDLAETQPRAIDGTDGIEMAFWSRDSTQLAFVAKGQLRRVAPGGGPVSLVVAANPRSGVWLADGDILLALEGEGLMRVAATGGSLRPADGFTSEAFRNLQIDGLDVSPDGRNLLFSQFGGETGIYVARVDGTIKKLLYPGEQSSASFVGPDLIVREESNVLVAQRFNANDMTLVGDSFPVAQNVGAYDFTGGTSGALSFIAGATVMSRLTWFTRDGKPAGTAGPEGEYSEVAISRGGRWLGFVRKDPADGNLDVWMQALPSGAPSRLTSDPDIDHLFSISPDERDVAWEAHAKGTLNLMRRPLDGSSAARVVRLWGKAGGPVDWSPDGRAVLYWSNDGARGTNLWVVPMDGAAEPVLLTRAGPGNDGGQFSPDGRWLAFTGDTTGTQEVYVQRVERGTLVGGPTRVSESGGQWPLWRRDGGELFFANNSALMAVEFHGQQDRPAGTPRTLFRIAGLGGGPFGNGRSFAVTADRQRVVAIVSAPDAAPHPPTMILNWHQSLERK
jgi:Tol biopolymer transport system component